MKTIRISKSVLKEIALTLGRKRPEQGGILGGKRRGREITHFFFDSEGARSDVTYSPDTKRLNAVTNETWRPDGIEFLGFIHTHPGASARPSGGDLDYARRILDALPKLEELLLFIATQGRRFEIHPWVVVRDGGSSVDVSRYKLKLASSDSSAAPAGLLGKTKALFSRVADAYDLTRLTWSRVSLVGAGGSAQFARDLARAGVGEFVLIDPDTVEESNVATQNYVRSQVGFAKVDALREDLLAINPNVRVVAKPNSLEAFSDDAMRSLLLDPLASFEGTAPIPPYTSLVCGCTDSFAAQARVARLGIKFGIPTLSAQVYREGRGAEITFTHPDTTDACQRCMLSSRYRAYGSGFRNDVTSDGTPIFSTARLNALKGFVALALLQHGTDSRWGRLLRQIGPRNLIQIRLDPDIEESLGISVFEKTFHGANEDRLVFDEPVFIRQKPEPECPDCGGTGDLRSLLGDPRETRCSP